MNVKKLFSYFLPVRVGNYTSTFNGNLEINLIDGKKVLDTRSSNYSYGSLQYILEKGLKAIAYSDRITNILVLGMGGGSIIESIRHTFHSQSPITLVDIDPVMADIARKEFAVDRFGFVEMVIADAEEFLLKNPDAYDLIIVDLFIIDIIPEKFTRAPFIELLTGHLRDGGHILYNSIAKTLPETSRNEIREAFIEKGLTWRVLKKVSGSNDLFIATKSGS